MVPPTQNLNLDITAISGICGSISIACWIVVFSPQIIENWKRGSADGLSLQFIIIWLAGDVFNIWGAMLQGVLPTMIILAVYYTIADIVLLGQCFYYKGFTWRDEVKPPPTPPKKPTYVEVAAVQPSETTGLLSGLERRRSSTSVSAQHLSPVVPLLDPPNPSDVSTTKNDKPTTPMQTFLFNLFSILLVCIAGILGWWISTTTSPSSSTSHKPHNNTKHPSTPTFSPLGQIFGYLCAILYLSSRIPQLLLNYRRKSTQGISMLFFLFACIGNLTYVLSIFAYEAPCLTASKHGHSKCEVGEARSEYLRYIAVNASWLVGSAGTLMLDVGVFVQFFLYGDGNGNGKAVEEEVAVEGEGEGNGGVVVVVA